MLCGYFRVFLTLLAAFGSFFGYLCRLNLSLVIDEMVVKDQSAIAQSGQDSTPVNFYDPRRHFPGLDTEEETFAELAAGNWWIRQRALLHQVKLRPSKRTHRNLTKTGASNARSALPRWLAISPLSIEFDVSKRAGGGGSTGAPSPRTPTTTTTANLQATTDTASGANPDGLQPAPAPMPEGESGPVVEEEGLLLNWNQENRNDLLGAFFLGYVIFQVPAGRAAELFGAKLLLIWLGLGTGLSSLVFPYAARYTQDSIVPAYCVRVIMGASQAGLFPAAYVLLCRWLPKNERSSWLAVPSAMGRLGTIVMNLVVPVIMLNYNWEWVFYLSGLVTLAWTILVVIFGSDSPAQSWWLSREELGYIESHMERPDTAPGALAGLSLGGLDDGSALSLDSKRQYVVKKPDIDWLKLITSRALIMLTLVMFTSEWSNMLLLIKLPGFLGPALNMGLDEIGFWSSALVLIYCVVYPLSGVAAARLESRRLACMDSLRIRKLFEAMAHALQATGCLIIATFDDKPVVIGALVAMMVGRSLVGGGQCLMPPELSKDYPGSVLALANSIANCAGIAGPFLLNYMVEDPNNYNSWRGMWLLSATVFSLAGLLFCCLADNRPQNYARRPKLKRAQTTSLADLVLPAVSNTVAKEDSEQATTKRRQRKPSPQREPPIGGDQNLASDTVIRMGSFARVSSEPQHPSKPKRKR